MKFEDKKKVSVVGLMAFTLLISVLAGKDSPRKTSYAEGTENYVGAITSEQYNGLTVGAMDDVDDYSVSTFGNNNGLVTSNQLFLEDDSPEGTVYGYSNIGFAQVEGNLNVRKSATSDAEIAGKLTNNNAVDIVSVSEDGQWYEIKTGELEGFVSVDYIVTGQEALNLAADLVATYATVNADSLNVREQPNTDCDILTKVSNEEDLLVTGLESGWVEVAIGDEIGYVSIDYVTLSNGFQTGKTIKQLNYGSGVSETRAALCQYALQFVGGRYVWGGTSLKNGVDCSGFTMQVYAAFGISLPHHSASQIGYGKKIDMSEARPGDLIFYNRGGGIGHVAIYIGGGQIVHAASTRQGIIISSAYYSTPRAVVSYLP